jgi:Iron-containing redox enzyme
VTTASVRLERKLDLVASAFDVPGQLLLDHPRARELYPPFAAAGAYLTLTMVPLMEAALDCSRILAPRDPIAAGLARYLERHIPEEMHGGEPGRAALDDLEAIGVDTVALREGRPPPRMAEFIGTHFYWIWHRHPVAVLGFLSLEAFHPYTSAVEQLIERTGLPRDGFRQLLLHAKLDVVHAEELHRVIDSLPLEPQHEQLIALSAFQTMAALIDAWLDVVADGASVFEAGAA